MDTSELPLSVVQPAEAQPRGDTLARNAFYLLLGQIASTALSIGLNAALGRTLGPADFGVYFLLLSMSTFAYVFVDWGQSALVVRDAAREPGATGTVLGSALVFRASAASAAILTTAALAGLLGYAPRTQWLAALMVFCALPLALSQPYGYLFRSRDRMDLDAVVTLTAKAITVAATITVLVLGGHLASVVLAQGLGGVGALAAAVLLARRIGLPRPHANWGTVRQLGAEGTSIAIFFVAIAVEPYIDAIVLSKLTPANVVGWYGAARNIMGVLIAPAGIIASAAFPQLSRAASSRTELNRVVRSVLRPLLGLGALGAVGTFLFADVAVSVVYSRGKFGPAVGVLELFAPTLLLFFIDMLFASVATATGKTRALAIAKLVSVAISTGLAFVFVPLCQRRFGNGGLGIVLAFGVSEVVMLVACTSVLPRGTLDRTTLLDFGRAILAGAGTLTLHRAFPSLSPWLGVPLCIGAFVVFSLSLGLLSRRDLSNLFSFLKRR